MLVWVKKALNDDGQEGWDSNELAQRGDYSESSSMSAERVGWTA